MAIVVLLLGVNSATGVSAQSTVRVPSTVTVPARTSGSKPLVTPVSNSAAASRSPAAVTIPAREVNRLRIRRSGAGTPPPEVPAISGTRPLSTTMSSAAGDDAGRAGRDRDRGDHFDGDRHGRGDRDHDRGYGYGWGYNPGYWGTGVEIGIEIAEIGIEIADIGLHGLRDNRIVGSWRGYRGSAVADGEYADVVAAELPTELPVDLPATQIEVGADGTFAWGDLRGRAREIVPHFARGGDRFFLIRDGADEYVIMIDADGEARLLDGVDAIRRGDHLR